MLKYSFNINTLRTDLKKVEVSEIEFSEFLDKEDSNKVLCVCHYDVDNELSDGDEIVFLGKRLLECKPESIDYEIFERNEVCSKNDNQNLFTVVLDKYTELETKSVRKGFVEEKEWLYFSFSKPHVYNSYDENINLVVRIDGTYCFSEQTEGTDWTYETDKMLVLEGCEWVNHSVLRYDVSKIDVWSYLEKILFKEDFNEANLPKLTVFRENILLDKSVGYGIYMNKPLTTLSIGLTSNPDVNLLQNENISEYFVADEIRKSINPIVEMEKCIFHPAIVPDNDTANKNKIDGDYTDVYEIEINLHFRPHKGEDWTVDDKDFWNGVQCDVGNPSFIDDCFSFKDKSRQSDLLGYLDFDNGDVKFQKNKLKKSFLRLSFYDSDKPYKQNLLSYSTVFHDCGNLFNKYVRHIDENTFSQVVYEEDEVTSHETLSELTGLRVNREPMATMFDDDNEAEECRLSSRFVIKDRYNSRRSSEGFHIYLWKENTDGVVPQDLYLKVEYNHAGYGRVLPFMMPWDKEYGIKTFEDILKDWTGEDGGYGIRKYLRYSYIHFKYCFDKKTNKGIYYLDPEQYGYGNNGVDKYIDDNKIVLNLYEAKIRTFDKDTEDEGA